MKLDVEGQMKIEEAAKATARSMLCSTASRRWCRRGRAGALSVHAVAEGTDAQAESGAARHEGRLDEWWKGADYRIRLVSLPPRPISARSTRSSGTGRRDVRRATTGVRPSRPVVPGRPRGSPRSRDRYSHRRNDFGGPQGCRMGRAKRYPSSHASPRWVSLHSTHPTSRLYFRLSPGNSHRDMRRGAYDLRAHRRPPGSARPGPHRLQNQKVLFGEHRVSSSAIASPLVWRRSGDPLACHAADFDFRSFRRSMKMASSAGRMFHRGSLHETRSPIVKRHPRTGHASLGPAGSRTPSCFGFTFC